MDEAALGRTCPGCDSRMQVFAARGVEIDRCPFCGGIWFDRGELATVAQRTLEVEPFAGHTTRRCAYCRITLVTAFVGSVPAEVCTACTGTYLDDGELQELARRPVPLERVGGPERTREEITYRCVGCGDALSVDTGIATSRGMSCRNCYGQSDFGGPSPTSPRSSLGTAVLLDAGGPRLRSSRSAYGTGDLLEDASDLAFPGGFLLAAIRSLLG